MILIPLMMVAVLAGFYGGYVTGKGHPAITDSEADTLRDLARNTEEETRIICRRFDALRRTAQLADGLISSGQPDKAQAQLRIAIIAARTQAPKEGMNAND